MPRKKRNWKKIHADSCYRKVRFATYELAEREGDKHHNKYGTNQIPYFCLECGCWHLRSIPVGEDYRV